MTRYEAAIHTSRIEGNIRCREMHGFPSQNRYSEERVSYLDVFHWLLGIQRRLSLWSKQPGVCTNNKTELGHQ